MPRGEEHRSRAGHDHSHENAHSHRQHHGHAHTHTHDHGHDSSHVRNHTHSHTHDHDREHTEGEPPQETNGQGDGAPARRRKRRARFPFVFLVGLSILVFRVLTGNTDSPMWAELSGWGQHGLHAAFEAMRIGDSELARGILEAFVQDTSVVSTNNGDDKAGVSEREGVSTEENIVGGPAGAATHKTKFEDTLPHQFPLADDSTPSAEESNDRMFALFSLGHLYQNASRHQDAVDVFLRSGELALALSDPNMHSQILFATARSQAALGDTAAAVRTLEQALKANSSNVHVLPVLASYYAAQNRLLEATNLAERAVQLDSTSVFLRTEACRTLDKAGAIIEATKHCEAATRLAPGEWRAWFRLGFALQKLGNYSAAVESYAKSAVLNPMQPQTWSNMATMVCALTVRSTWVMPAAVAAMHPLPASPPLHDNDVPRPVRPDGTCPAWTRIASVVLHSAFDAFGTSDGRTDEDRDGSDASARPTLADVERELQWYEELQQMQDQLSSRPQTLVDTALEMFARAEHLLDNDGGEGRGGASSSVDDNSVHSEVSRATVRLNLGHCLLATGRLEEASGLFSQACVAQASVTEEQQHQLKEDSTRQATPAGSEASSRLAAPFLQLGISLFDRSLTHATRTYGLLTAPGTRAQGNDASARDPRDKTAVKKTLEETQQILRAAYQAFAEALRIAETEKQGDRLVAALFKTKTCPVLDRRIDDKAILAADMQQFNAHANSFTSAPSSSFRHGLALPTFRLPSQLRRVSELWEEGKLFRYGILKHALGADGQGIRVLDLAQDDAWRQLKSLPYDQAVPSLNTDTWVLQEYLDDPLLRRGHKIDLRLYVMVASVAPLRLYLHTNSTMVRSAMRKYQPFTPQEGDERRSHGNNDCSLDDEICVREIHFTASEELRESGLSSTHDSLQEILLESLPERVRGDPAKAAENVAWARTSVRALWLRIKSLLAQAFSAAAQSATDRVKQHCSHESSWFVGHDDDHTTEPLIPCGIPACADLHAAFHSCRYKVYGVDIYVSDTLQPTVLEVNRIPAVGKNWTTHGGNKERLLHDTVSMAVTTTRVLERLVTETVLHADYLEQNIGSTNAADVLPSSTASSPSKASTFEPKSLMFYRVHQAWADVASRAENTASHGGRPSEQDQHERHHPAARPSLTQLTELAIATSEFQARGGYELLGTARYLRSDSLAEVAQVFEDGVRGGGRRDKKHGENSPGGG